MYFYSLGLCYNNDLDKLADLICNIRESTLDKIDTNKLSFFYNILNEEVGEKFYHRTLNMQMNHRMRDELIPNRYILRKQIPIYIDYDKIKELKQKMTPRMEKIVLKCQTHLNKMEDDYKKYSETLGEDHPKTKKKQKEISEFINKLEFYINNDGINRATYEKLEKKYGLIFMNAEGGAIKPDDPPIKIDGKSPSGNTNVFETMHNKRNNRISAAKNRLREYLDKKGYTDDQYAEEHDKLVGTRVNPARNRLQKRSQQSVNFPIENIEQDPIYSTSFRVSKQQYRDDGTLR